MAVSAVSANDAYVRDSSKDANNSKVDTTTFLKLLVAQLKYQDPLQPQADTAFVAQMAQMTQMQETQAMSASIKNSQAYDMIGKAVYAEVVDNDTSETKPCYGIVTSVVIKDSIPYVVVGNQAIALTDIVEVAPASALNGTDDSTGSTDSTDSTVS